MSRHWTPRGPGTVIGRKGNLGNLRTYRVAKPAFGLLSWQAAVGSAGSHDTGGGSDSGCVAYLPRHALYAQRAVLDGHASRAHEAAEVAVGQTGGGLRGRVAAVRQRTQGGLVLLGGFAQRPGALARTHKEEPHRRVQHDVHGVQRLSRAVAGSNRPPASVATTCAQSVRRREARERVECDGVEMRCK
jgi:hypothetical protein